MRNWRTNFPSILSIKWTDAMKMNFDEMWIFTQVQLVKHSRSWSFLLAKSKMKQGLLEGILPEKLKHLRHSTHSTSAWWYQDSQGQLDALSLMSGNHHLAYKKPSKLTYYTPTIYAVNSQGSQPMYRFYCCCCLNVFYTKYISVNANNFKFIDLSFCTTWTLPSSFSVSFLNGKKRDLEVTFWAWLGTSGRSWESSDFICDSVDLCHTHPEDGSSWLIFKMCLNILVILDCRRTLNTTCPWCSAWFAVQSLLGHA